MRRSESGVFLVRRCRGKSVTLLIAAVTLWNMPATPSRADDATHAEQLREAWKAVARSTEAVRYSTEELHLAAKVDSPARAFSLLDAVAAEWARGEFSGDADTGRWGRVWQSRVQANVPVSPVRLTIVRWHGSTATYYGGSSYGPGTTIYFSARTVSASLGWTPRNPVASVSGPPRSEVGGIVSADPLMMLRGTGAELIRTSLDEYVASLFKDAAFAEGVRKGEDVVSMVMERTTPAKDAPPNVTTWRTKFLRDVQYLPTESEMEQRQGDTVAHRQIVRVHYSTTPTVAPHVVVVAQARPVGDKAEEGLAKLDLYLVRDLRTLSDGDAGEVRIPLPVGTSIEDRSTGEVFHGSGDEPGRWPAHWNEAFVPPAGAAVVPGPAFAPKPASRRAKPRSGEATAAWPWWLGGGALLAVGATVAVARRRSRRGGKRLPTIGTRGNT